MQLWQQISIFGALLWWHSFAFTTIPLFHRGEQRLPFSIALMAKRKKLSKNSSSNKVGQRYQGKTKLRTASEVLSKLRWSPDATSQYGTVLVGYMDRSDGPMEQQVEDFAHSDVPEHRIHYFRNESLVLWDRVGRVDRVFDADNGCAVAPATIQLVDQAQSNVQRIQEQRRVAALTKQKTRVKRVYKRSHKVDGFGEQTFQSDRFIWETISVETDSSSPLDTDAKEDQSIVFVTWNVLFDLFRSDNSQERWQTLMNHLSTSSADFIALQETTPNFTQLILSQKWVQDHYATFPAVSTSKYLDPFGNMILWKRNVFVPYPSNSAVNVCLDGSRKRVVVTTLKNKLDGAVWVVANVHLTADSRDGQRRLPRHLVRQRELSATLAKMQVLVEEIRSTNPGCVTVPVILGDFNNNERNFIESGFVDVMTLMDQTCIESTSTYDPERNELAAKSQLETGSKRGPRAIDRIFVLETVLLHPESFSLLGVPNGDISFVTPSDHFGVCLSFQRNYADQVPYEDSDSNMWAANALPSPDTILALVLKQPDTLNMRLFDPGSSLPIPHITLLNGFVELNSKESHHLATEEIRKTVKCLQMQTDLSFSESSVEFFDHKSTSTLVLVPDMGSKDAAWLRQLYESLRSTFTLCSSQEDRFENGWTPHVSLGTFGSTSEARQELNKVRELLKESTISATAHAIGIYQRDLRNGMFYLSASVPLTGSFSCNEPLTCDVKEFLTDAGNSWSSYAQKQSTPVLLEIGRACREVADSQAGGELLRSNVLVYGSHALDASLPGVSDVDAVVELTPIESAEASDTAIKSIRSMPFLQKVATNMLMHNRGSMARLRVAKAGTQPLDVLTVAMGPTAPSVDLMLCLKDAKGEPVNTSSHLVDGGIRDVSALYSALEESSTSSDLDLVQIFKGALRIIKLWAIRRNIYGSSLGYIGGGGWAVFLACFVLDSLRSKTPFLDSENDNVQATWNLVACFFDYASKWEENPGTTLVSLSVNNEPNLIALRGAMPILAPASGGNLGRSTTQSTVRVTFNELKRAALTVPVKATSIGRFEHVMEPYRFESSAWKFNFTSASNTLTWEERAQLEATASSFILRLLVLFEQEFGPIFRPLRLKDGETIEYFIGTWDGLETLPRSSLIKIQSLVDEHLSSNLSWTDKRPIAIVTMSRPDCLQD